MKIQVLGSGCCSCNKLHELVNQAVKDLKIEAEVEYTDDVQRILEMGVMSSPVIAIDGKPVLVGTVQSLDKIKDLINGKGATKDDIKSEGCCSCGGNC